MEEPLSEDVAGLVRRSNLLGGDLSVVNYGGGNTSSKLPGTDHLGRDVKVLWIKGSGSDLATISASGFAPLRLDEITSLASRDEMTDDEMVDFISRCALDPRAPRPSIETVLHAFIPAKHVDHTHPEAAIAFCCCDRGEELAAACFGDMVGWVRYVRPGFGLAKLVLNAIKANPRARALLLEKHGLVTWGETGEESFRLTLDLLAQAKSFLETRVTPGGAFGGSAGQARSAEDRRALLGQVLPALRGELSRLGAEGERVILHYDDSPEVMEFACSRDMESLASTGAACPDHVMYTKFLPMIARADATEAQSLTEALSTGVTSYVESYRQFFEDHTSGDVGMLYPGPRVILIPGFGMVTAGRDAWTAANTAALYRTAIRVMRWASAGGRYTSLTPKQAWDIEYWPLELYKLTLKAPPRELAGRVAVITGGAGAIGRATARRLLSEGAHVVISEIDSSAGQAAVADLAGGTPERIQVVEADATRECDTDDLYLKTVLAYGGVDIVIPNAGAASAGPIEALTVDEWDRIHNVALRGYFLTCRAAFRIFQCQGLGGAIVINGSKNGLAPGKNALAYTTAKAAVHHMARCLAEEGGPHGIRVNAVAPDAVIEGSGLWSKEWRDERARAYGFDPANLEEFYRDRNSLRVSVRPDDVAEAILFLASERSSRTTGCIIPVDGGLAAAYPR